MKRGKDGQDKSGILLLLGFFPNASQADCNQTGTISSWATQVANKVTFHNLCTWPFLVGVEHKYDTIAVLVKSLAAAIVNALWCYKPDSLEHFVSHRCLTRQDHPGHRCLVWVHHLPQGSERHPVATCHLSG